MDERTRQYLESGRALTNGQIPAQEAPTGLATRPITSDILSSTAQPVNFQTPTPSPVFPVGTLDATPPATLTPEEQRAQGLSRRIEDLSRSLVGESAYRAEQEKAQDIAGLSQTQRDIATQLKQIQAEAQAIPLQLQQDSTARGRTAGGVAPLQTAALRNNAIRALTVGSLLEASRGNLTTALDLVDRAVAQRFDPIKSEIEVTKSNLQRIIDSPQYSLEQKNRAQAQLDLQKQRENTEKTKEENTKTIYGLALSAQQNGAPTAIVSTIMSSPDLASALKNAGTYLENETEASIKRYNFAARNGYKGSYTQFLDEEAARKRKETGVIDPATGQTYANELEAVIGNVPNLIQSQNGKVAFASSIKRARSDADKLNAVATVVLKNSTSEVRNDFVKQAQAISSIDKAIAELDKGAQTGVLQNAAQYTFNVFGKDFDPKLAAISGYITSAIQPYRSSITGAAWGEQEEAEYSNLFGSTKFSPTELKERLVRLKEIMRDKSAIALNTQINPLGTQQNFFTPIETQSSFTSPSGKTYKLPY